MNLIDKFKWDLIYLGFKKSSNTFNASKISEEVIVPLNRIRGAYGYALHARCFPYIYKNFLYNGMEIDAFFEFFIMKQKKVFAFFPQIINHRDKLKSTITDKDWKNR
jgi:hypothetical protein